MLFHFTDANPNGMAGDYSAVITWGDGSTSTVTSTATADGQIVAAGGGFDVIGIHTYQEEGSWSGLRRLGHRSFSHDRGPALRSTSPTRR